MKIWLNLNLWFARVLAILMVGGLIWGLDFILHINTEWLGYPTLCGIFCVCVCLTVVILVLNVIATILVNPVKRENKE